MNVSLEIVLLVIIGVGIIGLEIQIKRIANGLQQSFAILHNRLDRMEGKVDEYD